jgi:DNA recombination protein RmuC
MTQMAMLPAMLSTVLPATLTAIAAVVVAGLLGYLIASARSAERIARLREEVARARAANGVDESLLEVFRTASGHSMAEQSEQFLALAETRYQTLERSAELHWKAQGDAVVARLEAYAMRLGHLEEQRQRESAVLGEAVVSLRRSNEEIRTEARRLAGALKDNKVRGSWGEVQLRRVLEQAGMVAHADFVEQRSLRSADGAGRPDVVVRLPNGRCVVIDAKAPLDAYLRATECEDERERTAHLVEHGRAVASHATALSRRDYEHLPGSVDFVVMFVPGDAFLSAAFDAQPALFESAANQDVILASPGTLLAFLRAVACGWRERQVAEEAEQVAALGKELHERVARFAEHFGAVGASLGRAVGAYNQAVGSMERRLLVTARRFEDHGAGSRRDLPEPQTLVDRPLLMSAPELVGERASGSDEVA